MLDVVNFTMKVYVNKATRFLFLKRKPAHTEVCAGLLFLPSMFEDLPSK